jgi:hypothetical protein
MAPPSDSIHDAIQHENNVARIEDGGLVLHGGNQHVEDAHHQGEGREVQLGGGVRVHSAQEAANAAQHIARTSRRKM